MAVQVTLEDHTGNVSHQAKMVDDVPVQRLIPATVTALGLPITDPAGRPITYHLSHSGRRLQEDETLQSASVQAGDTLTIVPEMTAGASLAQAEQAVLDPLVALGPPVCVREPIIGFPQDYHEIARAGGVETRFSHAAMSCIWMQARAHPRQEVGGLLVGAVYQEGERFLVAVRTALPGRHTWAGQAFLTFTGRTWIDLVRRRRAYPESVVVGWYHSHPGLGIFLSSNDRFIHRSFFADYPWYLALVVDPISGWWGTFTWDNGEIVSCVEGFTGRSPAGKRRN